MCLACAWLLGPRAGAAILLTGQTLKEEDLQRRADLSRERLTASALQPAVTMQGSLLYSYRAR